MTTFKQLVQQMARATGLSVGVINAQVMAESGYRANAVSSAGAEGWLQFEPYTYNEYAAAAGVPKGTEFNPADEAKVYIVFMNTLLKEFGGNVQKALAAYNAGPGNIAAGMGYANGILAQAGEGTSYAANAAIAAAAARPPVIPAKTVTAAKIAVRPVPTYPLSAPGRPSTVPRTTVPPKPPRLPRPIGSTTQAASGINRLSAAGRPGTTVNPSAVAAAAHAAHEAHLAHLAQVAAHPVTAKQPIPPKQVTRTTKGTGGVRIVNK